MKTWTAQNGIRRPGRINVKIVLCLALVTAQVLISLAVPVSSHSPALRASAEGIGAYHDADGQGEWTMPYETGFSDYQAESSSDAQYFAFHQNGTSSSITLSGGVYPTGSIPLGKGQALRGTIKSALPLINVEGGIYGPDGINEVLVKRYTPAAGSTSFSIGTYFDSDIKFGTLKTGDYLLKITAKDNSGSGPVTVISSPLTVVDEGTLPSSIALTGDSRPFDVMLAGKPFTVRGTVTSSVYLDRIEGGVYGADGESAVQTESIEVHSTSCDLGSYFDGVLRFEELPAGSYVYRFTAEDLRGFSRVLTEKRFDIADGGAESGIAIYGDTYPAGTVRKNSETVLKGLICSVNDLTSVKAGVYYAGGKPTNQVASIAPYKNIYDLRDEKSGVDINDSISLSALPEGEYIYRVEAADSAGNTVELRSSRFTIKSPQRKTSANPAVMNGIDVSSKNGAVDWAKVAAGGISYAIIRAAYTNNGDANFMRDTSFIKNYKAAKNAGLKVGAYIYTSASTEEEMASNITDLVNFFEEIPSLDSSVGSFELDLPVYIDVEAKARQGVLTKDALTRVIERGCGVLTDNGYFAGAYFDTTMYNNNIDVEALRDSCVEIFYAWWPSGSINNYDLSAFCETWQYTEKGTLNGVSGNVDRSCRYIGLPSDSYPVTVAEAENGTLSCDRRRARSGDTVTVTAVPDEGYFVRSVTVNGEEISPDAGGAYTFVMAEAAAEAAAVFEVIRYSLTVENGSGSGSYIPGEEVDISADPAAYGKRFVEWVSDGGGSFADSACADTVFTVPAEDVTVTAVYENIAAAPSDVSVLPGEGLGVTVSWAAAKDAQSYNVYRSDSFDGVYELIGTARDTSFPDTVPDSETVYYYRVTSEASYEGAIYESEPSAPCPVITGSMLFLTRTTDSTNTLAWTSVAGTSYYDVERSADGESFNIIASVSSEEGPGYIDDSLGYNREFFYRVTARGENGSFSMKSNTVSSVTSLAVTTLTASSASYNSVKLAWARTAGANGYEIYRGTDGTEPVLIKTVGSGAVSFTNTALQCGTEYHYYIRAFKTVNKVKTYSADSETVSAVPVPAAPAAPAAAPNDKTRTIKLTWKAIAGANGYDIERSDSRDGEYAVIGSVTAARSPWFTDDTAALEQKYFYRVKAFRNENGNTVFGNPSAPISSSLNLLAPTVRLASSAFNSARISWDRVTGATGYEVWRSDNGGEFAFTANITKGTALAYSNAKLSPGVRYRYQVRAYLKNREGVKYSDFSDAVEVIPEIDAPKTFKVARSGYNLKASWSAVGGASGYELYRSVNGKDFELIAVTTAKVKAFTDTGVIRGVQYSYKVRATGTDVAGKYSAVIAATPTLAVPGRFSAKAADYETITLKWAKSAGATGYAIYRSRTKDGVYHRIGGTEGNASVTYTDTGLDTGVAYYYVIKAMRKQGNTTGYSQCSAIKSAKPVLKAPIKPSSVKLDAQTARLRWTAPPGADGYIICRRDPGSKTFEILCETTDISFDDTGLAARKTYQYKIMAYRINSGGERAYSPYTGVIKRAM